MSDQYYCPFCQRAIEPEWDDDEDDLVYTHDDVPHDEDFDYGPLQ